MHGYLVGYLSLFVYSGGTLDVLGLYTIKLGILGISLFYRSSRIVRNLEISRVFDNKYLSNIAEQSPSNIAGLEVQSSNRTT